jgi:hypothetical protein
MTSHKYMHPVKKIVTDGSKFTDLYKINIIVRKYVMIYYRRRSDGANRSCSSLNFQTRSQLISVGSSAPNTAGKLTTLSRPRSQFHGEGLPGIGRGKQRVNGRRGEGRPSPTRHCRFVPMPSILLIRCKCKMNGNIVFQFIRQFTAEKSYYDMPFRR